MMATLSLASSRGLASSRTTVGFFQRLRMFEGARLRAIEALAACVEVRRLRRGASLWRSEEEAAEVYWVRSGVVRVVRGGSGDREVTMGYFGRGELLGVHPAARSGVRGDEATVHEDVAVLATSREAFDGWLAAHPTMVRPVLEVMAIHVGRVQQRLTLVSMHGAKARLAGLLLDLSQRFGVRDSRGTIIDLRLTHRELASLIGATRETVSVSIVELRNDGVVRTENRRIIVLDDAALERLSGAS